MYLCGKIKTMATITLKYDARNALAKKTIAYILSLGVFKMDKSEGKSPYDKKFVDMVKKQSQTKNARVINNVQEFWDSL